MEAVRGWVWIFSGIAHCLEEIIKQQSNNLVILTVVTFFSHNSSQKGFPSTDLIKMKNAS